MFVCFNIEWKINFKFVYVDTIHQWVWYVYSQCFCWLFKYSSLIVKIIIV